MLNSFMLHFMQSKSDGDEEDDSVIDEVSGASHYSSILCIKSCALCAYRCQALNFMLRNTELGTVVINLLLF